MPGGHFVGELAEGGVTSQVTVEHVEVEEVPEVLPGDALRTAQGADVQDGEQGKHSFQRHVAQFLPLANHAVWGAGAWGRAEGLAPPPRGWVQNPGQKQRLTFSLEHISDGSQPFLSKTFCVPGTALF